MNIAESIRANNLEAYQEARYPDIPDGEELILSDEDFTGVDFDQFAMGFAKFIRCHLDQAKRLYGQPITIEGGTARGLDMRGISAIIHATNVDFTGLQYDDDTQLAYGTNGSDAASTFTGCRVDAPAVDHFTQQGVVFRNSH